QDGHSHLLASTIPNIRTYDPAFAYEIAAILHDGLIRMYRDGEDVFYYITLQNESYPMPSMPESVTKEEILQGLYPFRRALEGRRENHVQLFGSGSILLEVLRAQEILETRFGVSADVWSATSYLLLRRDALATERWNMLHPEAPPRRSFLETQLAGVEEPVIAATDFLKAVPDQIARWVPGGLTSLGTDGYGRSDTREALRRHFEVDAESITVAALYRLARMGRISPTIVTRAITSFGIDPERIDPAIA
ncbi:MAG: pyruvate dehydrogenase (acetyl-transferring), homodimeric type, partial [Deltaproteobacteria bacterium]